MSPLSQVYTVWHSSIADETHISSLRPLPWSFSRNKHVGCIAEQLTCTSSVATIFVEKKSSRSYGFSNYCGRQESVELCASWWKVQEHELKGFRKKRKCVGGRPGWRAGEMSIVPKDTIHVIAQSIGITNLHDDVAAALAPDVEYRMREIMQVWMGVLCRSIDLLMRGRHLLCKCHHQFFYSNWQYISIPDKSV